MAPMSLTQKLGLKAWQQVLLVHPPSGYRAMLNPVPEGVEVLEEAKGRYDVVQLFVHNKAELDHAAPAAIAALKDEGQLWIAFPKGSSRDKAGLTRDVGWETVQQAGLEAVSLVAIDTIWSAFRFRRKGDEREKDLLEEQYAGAKATLRPIYERIVAVAQEIDSAIGVETRNTYVALVRRRQFATIRPATRTRIDLGLKLPGVAATQRLEAVTGSGSGAMTHRVVLTAVAHVDAEVEGWLRTAYEGAG